jgi:hypothetical protein
VLAPLAALGWLLICGQAAVPAFEPARERVLVGPGSLPCAAASSGRWRLAPGRLEPRQSSRKAFFLSEAEGFQDGQIRVRLEGGAQAHASLLLRARLAADGRRLERAVGLRLAGRLAWPVMIEGTRIHRLGPKVLVARDPGRKSLEVVLTLSGPFLVADVFDGERGTALASLSASGLPVEPGGLGLLGWAGGARPSPVSLLAARPACQATPETQGRGPPLVVEVDGAEAEAAARLATPLERVGQPERLRLRTDATGLERLACAGLHPRSASNDLPWKYLDLSFLAASRAPPARRPDGGPELGHSLKSPAMLEAALGELAARHPGRARLEELGRSWQGRPLLALHLADGLTAEDPRPGMLLVGAHHGDEPMSAEAVLDAAACLLEGPCEQLDEATRRRVLGEMVVTCVPLANPDGLHVFLEETIRAGRKNGRDLDGDGLRRPGEGVDLNRNYPFGWAARASPGHRRVTPPRSRYYPGPAAASEPETQALMRLAGRERFVAALSFHTGTVALLSPYTAPGVRNPEPDEAWPVAEGLVADLDPLPGGRSLRVRRNLYPVRGVDQDWLRHAFGTLAFLVEAGPWPPPMDRAGREAQLRAARPLWKRLALRYLDGPSVSGRVLDRDGHPLEAEVRLVGQKLGAGERWTSRPRDGRFDRFLAAPGEHLLEVRAPGKRPLRRAFESGAGRVDLGSLRVP